MSIIHPACGMVKDWTCDDGNATTLMDVGNSVPLYIHIGVMFLLLVSRAWFLRESSFLFFCHATCRTLTMNLKSSHLWLQYSVGYLET